MGIIFKSKSEKDWYNFKIKRGYTKEQAERDILMNRRVSKKINKSVKKRFPGLKI